MAPVPHSPESIDQHGLIENLTIHCIETNSKVNSFAHGLKPCVPVER